MSFLRPLWRRCSTRWMWREQGVSTQSSKHDPPALLIPGGFLFWRCRAHMGGRGVRHRGIVFRAYHQPYPVCNGPYGSHRKRGPVPAASTQPETLPRNPLLPASLFADCPSSCCYIVGFVSLGA